MLSLLLLLVGCGAPVSSLASPSPTATSPYSVVTSTAHVPQLSIQATIPVGSLGMGITSADGAVWVVTISPKAQLLRIDPASNTVTATLDLPGRNGPGDNSWLAYGGGSLWISRTYAEEIDHVSIAPLMITARIRVADPFDVAYGFGSVWVPQFRTSTWSRIDPSTNTVVTTAQATGPTSVVTDAGSVWVLAHAVGQVLRIDPSTRAVIATTVLSDGPERIVAGFGSLWMADPEVAAINRIDEKTGKQSTEILLRTSELEAPLVVAAGGGYVWVGGDHFLSRIDPHTNRLTAGLTLPYDNKVCGPATAYLCIGGVTYANGSVWVVDWNHGQVLRVAPSSR